MSTFIHNTSTPTDENYPYTVFCDYFQNRHISITPREAIDIEIILNKTEYSRPWKAFGDILFKWRIDPRYYLVECATHYFVSETQFEWINRQVNNMR